MESLINKDMRKFIKPLCFSSQYGFQSRHSTLTQLLTTVHHSAKSLDKCLTNHAIFLDFSKSFDSVPYQRLPLKLDTTGGRDKLFKWVASFLNREESVIINGECSNWTKVNSGVPQGTVLGSLFSLFTLMTYRRLTSIQA